MSTPELLVLDTSRAEIVARIAAIGAVHGVANLERFPDSDVLECVCGWFYTREDHELHRAEMLAVELGLEPVYAPVISAEDGTHTARWSEFYDSREQAIKAAHDENLAVGAAYVTRWVRADARSTARAAHGYRS